MPAPSRVGTETIDNSSSNRDPATATHTTTSDTDLLLVCVITLGNENVTGTPTFDSDNLTLIHDVGQNNSSDVRIQIWGIVSPGAKTATVSVDFISGVDPSVLAMINYKDVDTASVAAATNFINDDVNDVPTSTGVHASGGSLGNTLFVVGGGIGADMQPASVDNSFVEIWDEQTGTSTSTDLGHIGAELLTGLGSGVTITYAVSDENTSVLIELVALVAAQDGIVMAPYIPA